MWGTVACMLVLCCSGLTVTIEMIELGVASGDVASSIFLSWVTLLIAASGLLTTLAGIFAVMAYKAGDDDIPKRIACLQRVLYLSVITLPLAVVLLVAFATIMNSHLVRTWLNLGSLEEYLGVDQGASASGSGFIGRRLQGGCISVGCGGQNGTFAYASSISENASYVDALLMRLAISLAYVCASLLIAAFVSTSQLGGKMFIIIKLTAFSNWLILFYGVSVLFAAHKLDSEKLSSFDVSQDVNPFNLLAISGAFMVGQSAIGILALLCEHKAQAVGRILLQVHYCSLLVTFMANIIIFALGLLMAMRWRADMFSTFGAKDDTIQVRSEPLVKLYHAVP